MPMSLFPCSLAGQGWNGMIKTVQGEAGWTYLEFVGALMVFSLLITLIYPILTVFKYSDLEKQMHLQALWLGQEAVERQIGFVSDVQTSGKETVQLDQHLYEVIWSREPVKDGLETVEVNVLWQIGSKSREMRFERYIFVQ